MRQSYVQIHRRLGAVTVYVIDLNSLRAPDDLRQILQHDEFAQISESPQKERRERSRRSHWALRTILATYAECDPSEIRLDRHRCPGCGGGHGKPYLANPPIRDLRFNLAHSGCLAVIAIGWGVEVGADLEVDRTDLDIATFAPHVLTETERQALFTLPSEDRTASFLAVWTRKEACAKADGIGLEGRFSEIPVGVPPANPTLVQFRGARWQLFEPPTPSAKMAATVAAEDAAISTRWLTWG